MMKWTYTTMAFMLLALSVQGQESVREYGRAIKLYNLTDWERYNATTPDSDTSFFRHRQSVLRIFHPTIAYQWQSKKGNYHELELTELHFSEREETRELATHGSPAPGPLIAGETVIRVALSLRYEYQWNLRPRDDKPWDFSMGLGINPYYFFQMHRPMISTQFPTRVSTFGTRLFAVPRFIYHLSPRVFLDVNVPICLAEYRHEYRYDESPVLPINDRGQSQIDFSTLPGLFSGRIGIGIKL